MTDNIEIENDNGNENGINNGNGNDNDKGNDNGNDNGNGNGNDNDNHNEDDNENDEIVVEREEPETIETATDLVQQKQDSKGKKESGELDVVAQWRLSRGYGMPS